MASLTNIKKARDIYYQTTIVPDCEIFTFDFILMTPNLCHYLVHADIDYSTVDSQTILGEYVLRTFQCVLTIPVNLAHYASLVYLPL